MPSWTEPCNYFLGIYSFVFSLIHGEVAPLDEAKGLEGMAKGATFIQEACVISCESN